MQLFYFLTITVHLDHISQGPEIPEKPYIIVMFCKSSEAVWYDEVRTEM